MTTAELRAEIYAYVKNEMNHSNDFDPEINIVEEGIVDSMAIVTLVQFLENSYGVTIEVEDINPENLKNVGAIANFIERLTEG